MLHKYAASFLEQVDVNLRGRLGEDNDDLKYIRLLNRILRVTDDGLFCEADPRHVELLSRSFGLQQTRLNITLRVQYNESGPAKDEDEPDEQPEHVNAVVLGRPPRNNIHD